MKFYGLREHNADIKGILMMVDIEKAFDSINHPFLMCVLKKFGFGNDFQKWIQILMKNPESCIINGGKTTLYFNLEELDKETQFRYISLF